MNDSGPEKLLLKQYEFLRGEIIQCIYLKQVAIIGMFTALLAAVAALLGSERLLASAVTAEALPFIAGAAALIANSFGSLYVLEQARNRRACSLNRGIEYLLTCLAWKAEAGCKFKGFLLWENYITDAHTDKPNRRFYYARTMGVGLPLLLFTVPLVVVAQVGFAPYSELARAGARLPIAAASIAMPFLLVLACALSSSRKPKAEAKSAGHACPRWLQVVLTAFYVSPAAFLLIKSALSTNALVGRAVLVDALAIVLGCWAAYTFFEVGSWLVSREKGLVEGLTWLAERGEFVKIIAGDKKTGGSDGTKVDLELPLRRAIKAWTDE